MKNICLIANFEKTQLFFEVTKTFNPKKIFWIVYNKKLKNYLLTKFLNKNILYLPKILENYSNSFNESNIIKLNEIINSDRSLKNNDNTNIDYLNQSYKKIKKFLVNNKINYVFGELTWSIEILTFHICKNIKLGKVQYFNPSSVRLPLDRFNFFTDIHQSKYFIKKQKTILKLKSKNFSNSQKEYSKYINKISKSSNSIFYIKKLIKIIFNDYFDKNDPTRISKKNRILKFFKKKINTLFFNLISKKKIIFFNRKKFVIFFLQKKPEQSMDVKGMYYDDNIKNIENIWKLIPSNYYLVIKEHPNNIGNYDKNFYKKILDKHNIYLIDPKENFNKLVKKSEATFSINSTASMESSLLKIPSFTFAKSFFNEMKYSLRINTDDIIDNNLFGLISKLKDNDRSKEDFKKLNYLKNSFEGNLFGEKLYYKSNIENLRKAILYVCK